MIHQRGLNPSHLSTGYLITILYILNGWSEHLKTKVIIFQNVHISGMYTCHFYGMKVIINLIVISTFQMHRIEMRHPVVPDELIFFIDTIWHLNYFFEGVDVLLMTHFTLHLLRICNFWEIQASNICAKTRLEMLGSFIKDVIKYLT